MKRRCLARVLVVLLALSLGLPLAAPAAPVGQFLTVEGRVEFLKGGKLPAIPATVGDGVEQGDVIRTKSASRAQVKFVDDTVLTIAPESRVAIEEYLYDAAKGQRHAVVRVFQGLVHTVVSRILRLDKPDFTLKTHTAVLGVRGSEAYLAVGANFTAAYSITGKWQAQSSLPDIPGLVLLPPLTMTVVPWKGGPLPYWAITQDDVRRLQKLMLTGIPGLVGPGEGPPGPPAPMAPADRSLGVLPGQPEGLQVPPRLPPPPVLRESPEDGIDKRIKFKIR